MTCRMSTSWVSSSIRNMRGSPRAVAHPVDSDRANRNNLTSGLQMRLLRMWNIYTVQTTRTPQMTLGRLSGLKDEVVIVLQTTQPTGYVTLVICRALVSSSAKLRRQIAASYFGHESPSA